jgi:GH15 family glucan-1,4-alpha-glucosidase
MSLKIEDYAMIGDCQTAALVGRDGSIDWLCWPRFDSASVFARIIGDEENGRWLITPCDPKATVSRSYRKNTLILESLYETADGAAVVIDFMTDRRPDCDLGRIVRGLRGTVRFKTELVIRPNYGTAIPWVRHDAAGDLSAVVGPDAFILRSRLELEPDGRRHRAEFAVHAGESEDFVLSYHLSYQDAPLPANAHKLLTHTATRWREWTKHFDHQTDYPDLVIRSLITLRALIYEPSGAIVAAPTTSLPEALGGSRNWDYRYCWLRDATFTLFALMNGGYYREARNWRAWLLHTIGGDASHIQIMYGIGGEQRIPEMELQGMSGYEGSLPVRVGNAAAGQLQIDIYGELLDALYQARKHGLTRDDDDWTVQLELLKHLESVWREKDEGIWEVRGPRQHFVYSKVMAWVAFDRAIKTVEEFGLPGPVDHWRTVRAAIHADVCEKGWNEDVGAFTQSYESSKLDASILLMPLTGFLEAHDPRIRRTVEAVERTLIKDGFVRRYLTDGDDGLEGTEGAFIACSFWFVDNLVLIGRRDEARAMFERLTSIATDLGFLSEEFDTKENRLIGNFPQAFSHIAMINSAFNLRDIRSPAEERSAQDAESKAAE